MTIDEVNKQFDDLQAAVAKAEDDLTKFIQGLKDQIAAGVPITQAQLDALGAGLKAVTDNVANFDINTVTPPAPVPPIPAAAMPKKK